MREVRAMLKPANCANMASTGPMTNVLRINLWRSSEVIGCREGLDNGPEVEIRRFPALHPASPKFRIMYIMSNLMLSFEGYRS
jgi:hypothetical protein